MEVIFTTIMSFIVVMTFYYICILIYNSAMNYLNGMIRTSDSYEYYSDYGDNEMTEEAPKNECCKNACGCSEDAGSPKEFELYSDNAGEIRWRLKAKNGRVIATSGEGYKNKSDAEHAISLVKNASNTTVVEDLT